MVVLVFTSLGMAAVRAQTSAAFQPQPTQPAPVPTASNTSVPGAPSTSSAGTGSPSTPHLPDGYSYLDAIDGRPVLVDACQPVAYHIEQSEMPAGGEMAITTAISLATKMTGLVTTVDSSSSGTGTSITISYKHEDEDPGLAGNAIGVAHVQSTGGLTDAHISNVNISLEIEWFDSALRNTPDLATMVVLHEILHGNGLDHVNDPTSIMYYSARATSPSDNDYQAAQALNPGCAIQSPDSPMGTASATISIPIASHPSMSGSSKDSGLDAGEPPVLV